MSMVPDPSFIKEIESQDRWVHTTAEAPGGYSFIINTVWQKHMDPQMTEDLF